MAAEKVWVRIAIPKPLSYHLQKLADGENRSLRNFIEWRLIKPQFEDWYAEYIDAQIRDDLERRRG